MLHLSCDLGVPTNLPFQLALQIGVIADRVGDLGLKVLFLRIILLGVNLE